jgi:Domain of unknown function (DUF4153)
MPETSEPVTAAEAERPDRWIAPPAAPKPLSTVDSGLSVFGPQWPGPGRIAPPGVLIAAMVVAVAAAAMVSWERFGIGWFATGLIAAVCVTILAFRAVSGERDAPIVESPAALRTVFQDNAMRAVWAVLALALLSAGALRAADWLWWLCLPTALICGALALAGGRTLRGLILGAVALPIAVFPALPWAGRGFAAVRGRSGSSAVRIVAAVAVSIALVGVFGGLLAGADVVFAKVLDSFLPDINGATVARWLWNSFFFGLGTLGACFLAIRPPEFNADHGAGNSTVDVSRRRLGRIEWGVPVATLVVLFAGFVAVQATVLFGGADHVLKTAGLTYAEYARQGFWQLLWVTVLTLIVVGIAAKVARRETMSDRIWLRALLGAVAVLTLVIVASAISRMVAYEEAYGFTRLRLLVIVCEGWLGLVFVFVLLAGIRLRAPWLPRAVIASAALALVGIVAANPDHLIAQQNVARYARTGTIDLGYLSTLSPDAVPVLDRLTGDNRSCVLQPIQENLVGMGHDEWFEWNLGRQQARAILADYRPPTRDQDEKVCWDLLYPAYRQD